MKERPLSKRPPATFNDLFWAVSTLLIFLGDGSAEVIGVLGLLIWAGAEFSEWLLRRIERHAQRSAPPRGPDPGKVNR